MVRRNIISVQNNETIVQKDATLLNVFMPFYPNIRNQFKTKDYE